MGPFKSVMLMALLHTTFTAASPNATAHLRRGGGGEAPPSGGETMVARRRRKAGAFFVYDDVDWMAMTCDGVLVREALPRVGPLDNLRAGPPSQWAATAKHSDDFWFLSHALRHPNRTMDPAEARAAPPAICRGCLSPLFFVAMRLCLIFSSCFGSRLLRVNFWTKSDVMRCVG